jgi:two-component system, chemotaxis family, sensor kinase CheA
MSLDLEMEEILKVFFEESFEGLDAMESGLLALDAQADRETINTIFRAAHSIKGGAGSFGFMEISRFTHAVETLLDQMRNGERAVTPEVVQVLLQAVDVMRGMTESAQAKRAISTASADALGVELAKILAQKSPEPVAASPTAAHAPTPTPISAPAAAAASDEPAGWRIAFRPDLSLFKTCNDPIRMFQQLESLAPVKVTAHVEVLPPLDDLDPTQCYLAWTLAIEGAIDKAQITEVFDWVDANSSIQYESLGADAAVPRPAVPSPAAANAAVIQHAPAATPGAPAAPAAPAPPAASTSGIEPPAARPAAAPAAPSPAKGGVDAGSIRVATEKVDALINLVGELVITQSMLNRFADHHDPADLEALRRGLTNLSRNTHELQESVLKIRMLPISFSFNRFPRLVHELSRKLGKKIELKLTGESTELDKIVLEKIGDPLVHLVRNSLDHGIEMPAARIAAGKSETGTLELNAFHEGGSIIIEVKDDGAGLNKQRILTKARERGLIEAGADLTDEQIYNLIFLPGFSTAETVSDVSGRGVGMDVVRRNIKDLGGNVQIFSVEGRGSTMRIRLPLTLAILEGQVLRVGKEIYVVSLVSIVETVQPTREQINSIGGTSEVFRHREDYLPVIRLHELFDIEPDSRDLVEGLLMVVEADGRRAAILVDELLAQQQVVIKSLDTHYKQVPGLAGATIHGDGTVALILDVPGLIAKFLSDDDRRAELAA